MKKAIQRKPVWVSGLIGLIFGVLVLLPALKAAYFNHLFSIESRPAIGTVTDKGTRVVQGKHTRTFHWVDYTYVADGLLYHPRRDVLLSTWNGLETGASLPVKYLADRPGYSRVASAAEDRDLRVTTESTLAYGSVLFLIFTVMTANAARNNRARTRLMTRGIPTTGLVKSVEAETRGRSQGTTINFSFSDNRGQTVLGNAWKAANWRTPFWKGQAPDPSWQEGDSIPVHYDSQHSTRFTVDLDTPPSRT